MNLLHIRHTSNEADDKARHFDEALSFFSRLKFTEEFKMKSVHTVTMDWSDFCEILNIAKEARDSNEEFDQRLKKLNL
jgi:hypothetical protein